MFANVRADFQRYLPQKRQPRRVVDVLGALLAYGFLATLVYRYGRWTRRIRPRVVSFPFKVGYVLLQFLVDIFFGINISTNADIGPGLHIGHFGGIFLHGSMGANCSVAQNVTVGYKGAGKSTIPPVIGNNVYLGCGAVVIGAIHIGDDCVIGANATVVTDIPCGSTVLGPKAQVRPRASSAA